MVPATTSWMPIGEFSRRVGVSPDLLRKWERRYRVFTPARSPGGRRLYSRVDQARAEYMIRRVREGLPPAQAAQIALAASFRAAPRSSAAKSADDAVATTTTAASFESSLVPMLVADDRRRYVDANRAACLLLRVAREDLLAMTIDDLTPVGLRGETERLWAAFLRDGTQSGTFELSTPDGARVRVDYSAKANFEPGRHLSMLLFPASGGVGPQPAGSKKRLTSREREVLSRLAMGDDGATIALALGISPVTVTSHVRHCLEKLGARTQAHAIALGLQAGEIAIDISPSGSPPGRARGSPVPR